MHAHKNTHCRYCGSDRLQLSLSLGNQPPSNSFLRYDQIPQEERYPLDVYFCEQCFLVQLLDVVDPQIIFSDYKYLSSSSQALKRHYAGLACLLEQRVSLKSGDVVVDIGCNDGILLHGYSLPGLVRVGVEPSQVAQLAVASGLEVLQEFFGPEVSRRIVERHGTAKAVTLTNVFAHVDNITQFVRGLPPLLGKEGVFVIEAPYLMDMVDQNLFDTIYHEHLCYLSLTPMVSFFSRCELEVFDVERVPFGASGPALRVFGQVRPGHRPVQDSVRRLLAEEAAWGVDRQEKYGDFSRRVQKLKGDILEMIRKLCREGARLGGYGAPAKGNTLLNTLGITPQLLECIAETNPLKQGLLTPGSHIPIVSEEEFLRRMPSHALLLSWNYLDFFLEKSEYIRRGGKFIVPLPQARIVP